MTTRAWWPAPRLIPRPAHLGTLLLALLAYVPSLTAAPGRMPADTKLFLYLDPGRLVSDAPYTWDTRQFGGWVPHQTITYLWPSGPWYWCFDKLGVPDWVAHRLWIATLLFVGGLGVRWAARQLGLGFTAAITAAVVYQLSPYVLPYLSRTSLMLLPWAGLGWLVGFTVRAATRSRWRDAAAFALVLFTVGSPNATALMMIAPAPVLWLIHAAWSRLVTWRRAAVTALRIGALGVVVSLWWMAMLVVQGRYGADVLGYSETLEAVSLTSTSAETLRGLGYWLFYVRDPYAFATSAADDYMRSGRVLLAGFALVVVCLAGLAFTRWRHRRYATMLVFAGIVLAVGVHPISRSSPLMSPLADNSRSSLSLAMRSSTRALPLSTLGMALGAGALVAALAGTRLRLRVLAPAVVVALAVVNLPALFGGGFADPALLRDQDPPSAWRQAAAQLDRSSAEHRVLQLPGAEFGAFRWGYTVDPPLPGLTSKPFISRDLLPLGSPGVMDLLYALDDRAQNGTLDPASIAPVARFLGVDTIWVAGDTAFDRFRTPRPEETAGLYAQRPAGLGVPQPFGTPEPNVPDIAMVDETTLSDPSIGAPVAPVELVPVDDPVPIVRASDRTVVLVGSGDGLVDAAAAGLLTGDEAVRYGADLRSGDPIPIDALVIVTDSNRDRAHQWRGTQDVTGFTESGGPGSDVLVRDSADQRLPVFPAQDAEQQTTAVLAGGLVVRASGYGEPFAYRPEQRPAMAVDGNPATAWVVGDRVDPVGNFIDVSTTDGTLSLLQPQGTNASRMITQVRIEADGSAPFTTALDASSLIGSGQRVDVPPGVAVRVVITAVGQRPGGTDPGPTAVGFAELGVGAHQEVVRVPSGVLASTGATRPVDVVLTRERTDPRDRWRSDPEPQMVRELRLGTDRGAALTVTLRLAARAPDSVLSALAGRPDAATADRRLTGVPAAAGRFAVDGDPTTAWTSPFVDPVGSVLTIPLDPTATNDQLVIRQPRDSMHSTITAVKVAIGGTTFEAPVPPPDAVGDSVIALPGLRGDQLQLTVTAIAAGTTVDRRFAEPTTLPVSISEITGIAIAAERAQAIAPSCRDDLLIVNGRRIPLAVDGAAIARLLAGDAVDVPTCDLAPVTLQAGANLLVSTNGHTTGIDVDRVVLRSGDRPPHRAAPVVTVDERTRTSRTATVAACPDGCWLIFGEGLNDGWAAQAGGRGLGAPRQISGGFNGWWIPPTNEPTTVELTWTPQRTIWIAFGLTGIGLAACLWLLWRDRAVQPADAAAPPRLVAWGPRATWRTSAITACVLVAIAGLVVSPLYAVAAAVVGAAVVAVRRPALAGAAAVVLIAGLGAIVVRRQLTYRYFADAAWPGAFEDLHRAGTLAVVLLLGAALVDGESEPGN